MKVDFRFVLIGQLFVDINKLCLLSLTQHMANLHMKFWETVNKYFDQSKQTGSSDSFSSSAIKDGSFQRVQRWPIPEMNADFEKNYKV